MNATSKPFDCKPYNLMLKLFQLNKIETNMPYTNYIKTFDDRIDNLKKEIEHIEHQKLLTEFVGVSAAIVGDFTEGHDYHRTVTIGDNVFTKFGDQGVIVEFDFEQFNETGHLWDIGITFKDKDGNTETINADRCN
jgi:hypothetical protein